MFCASLTNALNHAQYILVYPIAQGKIINICGFHRRSSLENPPLSGPWIRRMEKDELLSAYSQWEPEVQTLLQVKYISNMPLYSCANIMQYGVSVRRTIKSIGCP